MDKKTIVKISLFLNLLTFALTVIACVIMFTGFEFMHGYNPVLESTKLGMLRFFTVQSNILMGIVALLFAVEEIKYLKGYIKDIPTKYYVLKLMGTVGVALTFTVVFTYLGPIVLGGIIYMLLNSNLFFHLIIPVLSIINFLAFERTNKLKFKHIIYGVAPAFLYSAFYITNVLIHMEDGHVSPVYDWYYFIQNGVWTALIVGPLILIITYLLSLGLYKINKTK